MQQLLNKLILFIFIFGIGFNAVGQDKLQEDILLIRKNRIEKNEQLKTIRPYIYSKNSPALKKYNPVNIAFGGLLFFYQNALSPQFSSTCLYNPSCSEFSKQSIFVSV